MLPFEGTEGTDGVCSRTKHHICCGNVIEKWGLSGSHVTAASNGYTVPVMMLNDCRTLVGCRQASVK